MKALSDIVTAVENYDDMSGTLLKVSKIYKVVKAILEHRPDIPLEQVYHVKERLSRLSVMWEDILNTPLPPVFHDTAAEEASIINETEVSEEAELVDYSIKTIMEDGSTGEMLPLTDACHHYESLSDVPWDIQKYVFLPSAQSIADNHRYWQQRHSIFSAYDEGIYMTDDAWFGVTPEPIALQVYPNLSYFVC